MKGEQCERTWTPLHKMRETSMTAYSVARETMDLIQFAIETQTQSLMQDISISRHLVQERNQMRETSISTSVM